MKYGNIREEELKNKVAHDFFKGFDCTEIKGCIDFAVAPLNPPTGGNFPSPCGGGREEAILWAEAKSRPTDLFAMFAQLILTIGKARTFDKIMPPKFLGAFDSEKIAFVPYYEIQELFYLNDFNWNVTSSNTATKEFQLIKTKVENALTAAPWQTFLFYFEKDEKELRRFIKENFTNRHCGLDPQSPVKLRIDKNNFKIIFNKWAESVMPTIAVDWEKAKKNGIIAGDFYLADLLSENNKTLKEKLFVLLQNNFYEIDRHLNEMEFFTSSRVVFKDKQKAHNA
ncbi:MAG: hypothetical protein LBR66_01635, partial [Candidatus Symbiothrix sp.]|nr:hypothetical protein [Candidatus Symbiothrix sp.]